MPRPAKPGRGVDDIVRAGGIDVYNRVFEENGGGQRGRKAAERAVRDRFPGVGRDTMAAVQRRAAASRRGAANISNKSPDYQLPINQHQPLPDVPGQQGQRRTRYFSYLVNVQWEVTLGGAVTARGSFDYTAEATRVLTRGQIEEEARQFALAQLMSLSLDPNPKYEAFKGQTQFRIVKIDIQGAFTQLRP